MRLCRAANLKILRMMASGKRVSEIGGELNISATTVSTYRARILEKLNMTNTAELIRYALETHLFE